MKNLPLVILAVLLASPVYAQSTLYSNSTSGNVGIGTTSPAGTLDVEGGTAAASTDGSPINFVAQSAGTGNEDGGNIIVMPGVATGTGTPGYVGIGTTDPSSMLQVNGVVTATGFSGSGASLTNLNASNLSSGIVPTAQLGSGTASSSTYLRGDQTWATLPGGSVTFGTLTTGDLCSATSGTNISCATTLSGDVTTAAGGTTTTVAKIQGTTVSGTTGTGNAVFSASPTLTGTVTGAASNWSGNVGIGTTSPAGTLDVEGGTAAASTNGTPINIVAQSAGTGNENGGNIIINPGAPTGTGTPGYVGIGTTSPALQLEIVNNTGGAGVTNAISGVTQYGSDAAGAVFLGRKARGTPASPAVPQNGDDLSVLAGRGYNGSAFSAANVAAIKLTAAGTFSSSSQPTYITFGTTPSGSTSRAEQMRITSTGSIGIGTTSPSYTLQVNGSVAGTSAYNNLSDRRVKKDVKPIAYGLDTVMKLRPIGFNWIAQDQEWKKRHQIGLIAQEVEPVVPEVVTTANDEMHSKGIAYGSLVPVLIKASQELNGRIEEQDRLIAEQAGALTKQQAEINGLKHLVDHLAQSK